MAALIAFIVVVLDQISKYAVMALRESLPIQVIPGIFDIDLMFNKGGAFSILQGRVYIFILVSIISILFIAYLLVSKNPWVRGKATKAALYLIIGGALGNLIDRVRYGAVIDFFDFKVWPVFNVADSAITIGVSILIIEMIMAGWGQKKVKV